MLKNKHFIKPKWFQGQGLLDKLTVCLLSFQSFYFFFMGSACPENWWSWFNPFSQYIYYIFLDSNNTLIILLTAQYEKRSWSVLHIWFFKYMLKMVLGICRTGKRSEANNMCVYIKHIHLPYQCYMIPTSSNRNDFKDKDFLINWLFVFYHFRVFIFFLWVLLVRKIDDLALREIKMWSSF
jgi:NADH:ubiquinone oxidoreductase subunit 3 (subunit A)